jgi:glycogen(starch) synthase
LKASMLVVGNPIFLARHRPLADALRKRLPSVEELPVREVAVAQKALYLARAVASGRLWPPGRAAAKKALQRFRKDAATFDRVSQLAARRLAETAADTFILQLFSMSSPGFGTARRRYAHYIDITMAMARRDWPPWAPFEHDRAYRDWIDREGATYRGAERVFTFSEATRRSVIEDYGARPERVVTVGAAGHYHEASSVGRHYGNQSLIFNGSDFERKGGDRVLEAFRMIRARFSAATLTVVANRTIAPEPGLHLPGYMSRRELFALFDSTDVVLAPTRMDVLPGFVLEAMSRGTVPVLSDAASMDEMITNGEHGYIVSPPTPALLAERVASVLEDAALLRRLGAASQARILSDWNWDAVARRMLASLEQEPIF